MAHRGGKIFFIVKINLNGKQMVTMCHTDYINKRKSNKSDVDYRRLDWPEVNKRWQDQQGEEISRGVKMYKTMLQFIDEVWAEQQEELK